MPKAKAKVGIRALREQLAAMTRERDAYKRAKGENDDRFMGERDKARMERDALAARLARVQAEVRNWQHGEHCEARDHDDECGWADDAHTTWGCRGETSTPAACEALEDKECDCGVAKLRRMLRSDL